MDRKFDWTEVRLRLEKTGAAIAKGYSPEPEDARRVLKARADALSHEPEKAEVGDAVEVIEFSLADERYAVESRFVREVCAIKDYTPLPGTPPFVLGLISVRGQVISVIDMKRFFDMPDKGIGDLNKAIVIHDDTMEIGILADSLSGVRRIPVDEIQPPLPTLTGIRERFLKGVTGEGMVLLDAGKLLSAPDIIVNEEV